MNTFSYAIPTTDGVGSLMGSFDAASCVGNGRKESTNIREVMPNGIKHLPHEGAESKQVPSALSRAQITKLVLCS